MHARCSPSGRRRRRHRERRADALARPARSPTPCSTRATCSTPTARAGEEPGALAVRGARAARCRRPRARRARVDGDAQCLLRGVTDGVHGRPCTCASCSSSTVRSRDRRPARDVATLLVDGRTGSPGTRRSSRRSRSPFDRESVGALHGRVAGGDVERLATRSRRCPAGRSSGAGGRCAPRSACADRAATASSPRLTVERAATRHPDRPNTKDEAIADLAARRAPAASRPRGCAFVSVLDPPDEAAAAVDALPAAPLLAGPRRAPEGDDDLLLGSPIILYDHPEVAPRAPARCSTRPRSTRSSPCG